MNSGLCEHCLRVAYLVTDMTIRHGRKGDYGCPVGSNLS